MRLRRYGHLIVAAAALAAFSAPVRAAERVTLRNGFAMPCNHHALAGDRVRLFTSPDEKSFIEVAPEEIAAVETVPDPPVEPTTQFQPTIRAEIKLDAKLSAADLHQMLSTASHQHNVDEDLLASLVKAESGGNTHAVSRTGARGLMQLMPHTAADMGVEDSFKPEQNVRGGTAYLDSLLTLYHDNLALALAAYNAGPGAVDKYHGIPPYRETKLYVARVIHEFNRRVNERNAQARRALAAATSIPTLSR